VKRRALLSAQEFFWSSHFSGGGSSAAPRAGRPDTTEDLEIHPGPGDRIEQSQMHRVLTNSPCDRGEDIEYERRSP